MAHLQKINETLVVDHSWTEKHLKAIRLNYSHAPYFAEYEPFLASLYEQAAEMDHLSDINYLFLTEICRKLGIRTKITWSSDYTLEDGKTERLAGLVRSAGGDYYLSGPAAKDYIVDEVFEKAGIELAYMDYEGYPPYPQLHGDFIGTVSIIDLLMMTGPSAPDYMKCFRK